ncbi:MAG: nucleotidyl transferase AbiEii/AbiGii toxin family protein [Candidatus Cloacimonadia bacterium]
MQIFEYVIDQPIRSVLRVLGQYIDSFYLGGRTGLALQIGHRRSEDLDFFSIEAFDETRLAREIDGFQVIQQYRGTVHGILNGIRLSFLHYSVPLINEPYVWEGIKIASIPDLIGEKFKAISQRGAKKDFCDLYAAFKTGISIQQGCQYFKQRFQNTGIQFYSILKGLTYFEDAESDPDPLWLSDDFRTDWKDIKSFFTKNIKEFEKELLY